MMVRRSQDDAAVRVSRQTRARRKVRGTWRLPSHGGLQKANGGSEEEAEGRGGGRVRGRREEAAGRRGDTRTKPPLAR
jgi:hypothetical protein